MNKAEATQTIRKICDAIADTVAEAGEDGAPGGCIYAALMAHGCSLETYEMLMAFLIKIGRVTKIGDLYFASKDKQC